MSKEKYLVIDPDGSTRWIQIERENMLREFHAAVRSDSLENVRSTVRDVCLIVDEVGKLRNPPQPHNELASLLYAGWIMGTDDIVGPAIVAAIHLVDGESDWVPVSEFEWIRVKHWFNRLGREFNYE